MSCNRVWGIFSALIVIASAQLNPIDPLPITPGIPDVTLGLPCPTNSYRPSCGSPCVDTCAYDEEEDTYTFKPKSPFCITLCSNECTCNEGYIALAGVTPLKCIPASKCEPQCPANSARSVQCRTPCVDTCTKNPSTGKYVFKAKSDQCIEICSDQCFCNEGYIALANKNKTAPVQCISSKICPAPPPCTVNCFRNPCDGLEKCDLYPEAKCTGGCHSCTAFWIYGDKNLTTEQCAVSTTKPTPAPTASPNNEPSPPPSMKPTTECVKCFKNPCDKATCPGSPGATCSQACDSCDPVWISSKGIVLTEKQCMAKDKCGPNGFLPSSTGECYSPCAATCRLDAGKYLYIPEPLLCIDMCAVDCLCKPGFIQLKNSKNFTCIPNKLCPAPPTPSPTSAPVTKSIGLCKQQEECCPGTTCSSGRNFSAPKRCITSTDRVQRTIAELKLIGKTCNTFAPTVSPKTKCPKYAEMNNCVSPCDEYCNINGTYVPERHCKAPCRPGCACTEEYLRYPSKNSDFGFICIPRKKCNFPTTQAPTPPKEYNCDTDEIWSPSKTGWCCKHEGQGCPEPAPCTSSEDCCTGNFCSGGMTGGETMYCTGPADGTFLTKDQWTKMGQTCDVSTSPPIQAPTQAPTLVCSVKNSVLSNCVQRPCDEFCNSNGVYEPATPCKMKCEPGCACAEGYLYQPSFFGQEFHCLPRDKCIMPTQVTTTSAPYNCNSREVWTEEKTEWCCKNEGKGCVPAECESNEDCCPNTSCSKGRGGTVMRCIGPADRPHLTKQQLKQLGETCEVESPTPSPTVQCPVENSEPSDCVIPECDESCTEDNMYVPPQRCGIPCEEGCACAKGYVRKPMKKAKEGYVCVPRSTCRTPSPTSSLVSGAPSPPATTCNACVQNGMYWQIGECYDSCIIADVGCYRSPGDCEQWELQQSEAKVCPTLKDCTSCMSRKSGLCHWTNYSTPGQNESCVMVVPGGFYPHDLYLWSITECTVRNQTCKTPNGPVVQGSTWQASPCTYCECNDPVQFPAGTCYVQDCAYPSCGMNEQLVTLPGKCCPICQKISLPVMELLFRGDLTTLSQSQQTQFKVSLKNQLQVLFPSMFVQHTTVALESASIKAVVTFLAGSNVYENDLPTMDNTIASKGLTVTLDNGQSFSTLTAMPGTDSPVPSPTNTPTRAQPPLMTSAPTTSTPTTNQPTTTGQTNTMSPTQSPVLLVKPNTDGNKASGLSNMAIAVIAVVGALVFVAVIAGVIIFAMRRGAHDTSRMNHTNPAYESNFATSFSVEESGNVFASENVDSEEVHC